MKKLSILSMLLLLCIISKAQSFLGLNNGNYAGVSGIYLNPACLADNRFASDVILTGLDITVANNYIGVKTGDLFNGQMFKYKGSDFKGQYLHEYDNTKQKSIYVDASYQFPSFMVSLSPKTTIVFASRTRAMVNVDNMNIQLAKLAYNGFDYPDLFKIKLENDQFSINTMAWTEYGVGVGQVVIDKGPTFLKVGGVAKILLGIEAGYFYAKDLTYEWKNKDTLSLFQSKFGWGHSSNLEFHKEDYKDFAGIRKQFTDYGSRATIGADLGVVYEWRPNWKSFLYDLDGKTNQRRRDVNKYKLRLGASMTDIGRIRFKKGDYSKNFDANIKEWDVNHLKFDPTNPVYSVDTIIKNRFKPSEPATAFNMVLPTVLSFQVDYNIWKGFYGSFVSYTAPRLFSDEHRLHALSYYTLCPRWESQWLGVYAPFSFNQWGAGIQGLALRLGPIVLGTNDVGTYLYKKDAKGVDFHFALKVPIPFGRPPRDKDHDLVSDRIDKCPDVKGSWEYKGCPDSDNDGVPDGDDKCPNVAGLKQFKGCPDSDNDGITDADDNCPNDFGLKKFKGCPDKDGDDIMDKLDSCPDVKGLAKFDGCPDTDGDGTPDKKDNCPDNPGPLASNGCPDSDGDGVIDIADKCPNAKGDKEHNGCPDTDGDGVYDGDDNCIAEAGPKENKGCPWSDLDKDGTPDKEDRCPDTKGPKDNHGCPYGDIDNDGVADNVDKCPNTPGPKENGGCPVVAKKEQLAVDSAVANLQYENGKALILDDSYKYLDRLADILSKHPTWKLRISGHTDNVGNDDFNLDLSRRRSEAVRAYIATKGINADRMKAEFYGKTKPVAPNDTPEGRAKNRRVEMKIMFD
ncbi:MAG: DUF5723 family protein [Bacteroidetes bacterium]|nr:DUF5723 family protein [Bacteroidota bacterium]